MARAEALQRCAETYAAPKHHPAHAPTAETQSFASTKYLRKDDPPLAMPNVEHKRRCSRGDLTL